MAGGSNAGKRGALGVSPDLTPVGTTKDAQALGVPWGATSEVLQFESLVRCFDQLVKVTLCLASTAAKPGSGLGRSAYRPHVTLQSA